VTTKTAILGVLAASTLACSGATFTVEMLGGPHRLLAKLVPPNSGLHKHHLVEVWFADKLKVAPGDIPAIALTPAEHAKYTSRWFEQIARRNMEEPIRTDNATIDNIWEAAQYVYRDAPELLEFVQMFMGK
jgi:hypothetical protein